MIHLETMAVFVAGADALQALHHFATDASHQQLVRRLWTAGVHAAEYADHRRRGGPAQEAITVDQQHVGAFAGSRNGCGAAGHAAAHHQYVYLTRYRSGAPGLSNASGCVREDDRHAFAL